MLRPFSYDLPEERIAQRPAVPYDTARLLVINRKAGSLKNSVFTQVCEEISSGDLLVFNDTRVLPARFFGAFRQTSQSPGAEHESPAAVEVFLIRPEPVSPRWRCIGKPLKKFKEGRVIDFVSGLSATVVSRLSQEEVLLEFSSNNQNEELEPLMQRVGRMPIPPYIRGGRADDSDTIDYQTMFAKVSGSIAAPTASLHFTPALITSLEQKGVRLEFLTLHVGAASIRSVVRDGQVSPPQPESMVVPKKVLEEIAATKARGARVIAVGTTVARALESAARSSSVLENENPDSEVISGEADIFITPGFQFKVLDGLFTNFHQPGTTHLLLVEAFMGRLLVEHSYAHALANGYRFLSYGDGTLIL
jgi:S-adenosylmethionine:tRNA ribosyltransferase-isomerase